ncbi:hypothetical protein ACH5RR_014898 [Cinchona calisaya]|uniref:DUF4283 domain-containing protein n=1 Tax=Cinchona calisaya TaxID=153742 RepID=A0ABD2ZSE8_9GENT
MAEELTDVMGKFKLSAEEDLVINLYNEEVEKGVQACKTSLLGKIFCDKTVSFSGIKSFTNTMRKTTRNFKIVELGPNLFQFNFPNKQEMDRVL